MAKEKTKKPGKVALLEKRVAKLERKMDAVFAADRKSQPLKKYMAMQGEPNG